MDSTGGPTDSTDGPADNAGEHRDGTDSRTGRRAPRHGQQGRQAGPRHHYGTDSRRQGRQRQAPATRATHRYLNASPRMAGYLRMHGERAWGRETAPPCRPHAERAGACFSHHQRAGYVPGGVCEGWAPAPSLSPAGTLWRGRGGRRAYPTALAHRCAWRGRMAPPSTRPVRQVDWTPGGLAWCGGFAWHEAEGARSRTTWRRALTSR